MSIITVEIPENVPVDIIKKKIQKVIKEESLKWRLFEGAKKELDLSEDDFKDFEEAREEAWKEIKKKYGL
jgi:tripartite-type tricarboxylate transporter receptor subunit TctC